MQAYLINLARRPDRLARITQAASDLGLTLTRVDAMDAQSADPAMVDSWYTPRMVKGGGPLGEIPLGDKCCGLSHRMAWQQFLESGAAYAAFLEDDVTLAPAAARFLKDDGWIPSGTELIKLEHYGPRGQRILVGTPHDLGGGHGLARLQSRHTGAAAYILSRKAAKRLLSVSLFNLPVDHLLFNPNNSPLFARLKPLQMIPAIARQQEFVGEKSDIERWRKSFRRLDRTYVLRELKRVGYDLKLVPRQLWALARGARFIPIAMEQDVRR